MNVDGTVVAQAPRLAAYLPAMMNAPRAGVLIVIFLVGLAINLPAFAQTEGKGGYVGVSIGEGKADLSVSDFNDGSITSGSVDDTDH